MRPILIAGPTASGKSALALRLAEALDGVVINADALQVYDIWSVLTARPDADELARAPHALYGHVAYDMRYSAGAWLRDVAPLLSLGRRPIIVGGTGLYFTALTEGLAEIPPIPEAIRTEADAMRTTSGARGFLSDLARNDPEILTRIDTANPMRLQRAWEVFAATGRALSDWQADTGPALVPDALRLNMVSDTDWLNARIARRFRQMLDTGALEEVEAALPLWDPALPSMKALGAAELRAYILGEMTLEDAIDRAIIATRQFAKRQRTWFRSKMKDWTRIPSDQAATLPISALNL